MPLPNHCIECDKPTTNKGLCDKCRDLDKEGENDGQNNKKMD